MNKRSTTPALKPLAAKSVLVATAVVAVLGAPMQLLATKPVFADEYDDKINAIQRQIDGYQAEANKLSSEAKTLENQLAVLANQKATIQALLDESTAKHTKLKADIATNEKKLQANKDGLGDIVADLYVDDKISPLEMLASSSSIGDYVDKQEQRSAIRDNLSKMIDENKRLKKELDEQRVAVERVIKDQEGQRSELVAKENERNKLLADTRGQEAAYGQLMSEGRSKQDQLRSQQQAAIAAAMRAAGIAGGGAVAGNGGGGYPSNLASAPLDALVDPWGMYNRECVSYTAWKVYQKNGYMPYWGGNGHAYQWPGMADRYGIPRGSTPRAGSVGVLYGGPYGHVVWVESVNGDGTINVSQYNEVNNAAPYPGMYSERFNVPASAYATYIYF